MRVRRRRSAFGCGFLALLLACGSPSATEPPRGAVLVLLDTLRADRISHLGYARPATPNLDQLGARGVVFERAVSNSSWTLPAMVGLLSGRFPAADVFFGGRLRASLIEQIASAGVATGAITEGGWVSWSFGMERGFGSFEEWAPVEGGPDHAEIEDTFAKADRWLRAHREKRFFLLLHTYEIHTPYTRRDFAADLDPGGLGATFRIGDLRGVSFGQVERAYLEALYDGGVRKADEQIGALLRSLAREGLDDRTLVVVTSDHGEDLGERLWRRAGSQVTPCTTSFCACRS